MYRVYRDSSATTTRIEILDGPHAIPVELQVSCHVSSTSLRPIYHRTHTLHPSVQI